MEFPKPCRTFDYEVPTIPVRCLADGCSFVAAAGATQDENHRLVIVHMILCGHNNSSNNDGGGSRHHKLACRTWLKFVNDEFDPLFDEQEEEDDDDDGDVGKKVRVPTQWVFGQCPVPGCRVRLSDALREVLLSHLSHEHDAGEVDVFLGLRREDGVQTTNKTKGPDGFGWFEDWAAKKREAARIECIRRRLKRKHARDGNKIPARGSPGYEDWYQKINHAARELYQTEAAADRAAGPCQKSVDDLLAINHILKAKLDAYVSQGNRIPNRRLREFGAFWQHVYKLACDEHHEVKLRNCLGGSKMDVVIDSVLAKYYTPEQPEVVAGAGNGGPAENDRGGGGGGVVLGDISVDTDLDMTWLESVELDDGCGQTRQDIIVQLQAPLV
ncbi:hypothetical protein V1517DRAFT_314882 [Lipomyces orientalis]|uniref:Uncharacterized protein n=1 Tax=Lipomyces orientalis TaxID=1233043 RepID=A0ACC3TVC2_9ASCO